LGRRRTGLTKRRGRWGGGWEAKMGETHSQTEARKTKKKKALGGGKKRKRDEVSSWGDALQVIVKDGYPQGGYRGKQRVAKRVLKGEKGEFW